MSPVQEALFEFVGEPEKTESVFVDYSEVEEGDAVTFYSSKDGGEKTVKIVNGPSVLDQGIVSNTTPLAQALLGLFAWLQSLHESKFQLESLRLRASIVEVSNHCE